MWKKIRVSILLLILAWAAFSTWQDMNQDWNKSVIVLLHPINADGDATTAKYIEQISIENLEQAQHFLAENSRQFRGQAIFFDFQLGRTLTQLPPKVPASNSMLNNILWSLKFRYYAWKQHQSADGSPDVTLYLNFYNPQKTNVLKHSVALQRGRIGAVNLFAAEKYRGSNQVVATHELLHTFGATDKYDMLSGQPIYPLGYAEPDRKPLYPQNMAEIMGGYIPLSESKSVTPKSLQYTMMSPTTAQEIGWIK